MLVVFFSFGFLCEIVGGIISARLMAYTSQPLLVFF